MKNSLTKEHFLDILEKVERQVLHGKGKERHGGDETPLEEQTWVTISHHLGNDSFLLGQALKKVIEMSKFDDYDRFEREALGAIAYLVFSVMYREGNKKK